jgi:hypothetical protein
MFQCHRNIGEDGGASLDIWNNTEASPDKLGRSVSLLAMVDTVYFCEESSGNVMLCASVLGAC